MSSITTAQGLVHYEVHGRGRPVILLHGWLGSWGLWQKTMGFLAQDYRTYALDFWGFGESGKKLDSYEISVFVDLVEQFMEQLGIIQAPVVGHSMGGTVALSFAIKYPERVRKVVVISSPVNGTSLSPLLKLAGNPFIASIVFRSMWALKLGLRLGRLIVTWDKRWPDMIEESLSKTTLESFLLSIASLHHTDLRASLAQIKVPVMGMFGARDVIVNPNQWKLVQEGLPFPTIARFKKAGHFPMLDIPEEFMYTLKDFLDKEDPNIPEETENTEAPST